MEKLCLILGIHNHQPVGNFEHVIEEVYQKSYRPFIEVFQRFDGIKIAYHSSGFLLEWIESNHPELLGTLRELVEAKRLEVLSGGFYEPILAVIPEAHRIKQIEKLNHFVETRFGARPRGLWLAERVWEPQIAKQTSKAGIEYVVLDDFHFKTNGFTDAELRGYYVTEEQGYALKIFPISEQLRYAIPFKPVDEVFQIFGVLHRNHAGSCVVMMDDGEKFGSWPHTYDWVFGQKWLEQFFQALEYNSNWIETITFKEYLSRVPALGRAYLSTNSYMEMNGWTLPGGPFAEMEEFLRILRLEGKFDRFRYFVRGGFWRNFLSKYRESNQMHKKMLFLSEKLDQMGNKHEELEQALFRAQCNDAYWHGVFGGLYLPHLRHRVFSELIEAEKKIFTGQFQHFVFDFDKDGNDEIVVENEACACYLAPALGGSLVEWDWKPGNFNLVNTLQRRPEGYHRALIEKGGMKSLYEEEAQASIHTLQRTVPQEMLKLLKYDCYPRVCLLEHFLASDTRLDHFLDSQYNEMGDFVLAHYPFKITQMQDGLEIRFSRLGKVMKRPVTLTKTLQIFSRGSHLKVRYQVQNESQEPFEGMFASEWCTTVLGTNDPEKYLECNGSTNDLQEPQAWNCLNQYKLVNKKNGWQWLWSGPVDQLWCAPIQTLSQSESGFEATYQGTALLHLWKLALAPSQTWSAEFEVQVSAA